MKFRLLPKRKHLPGNRVHTLRENYNLTDVEHARCVALTARIQRLYDDARPYAARNGLDPAIVFPANEWADIVPREGIKFHTSYNDINHLRLSAPFIGYHLTILDRLDNRRRFPGDGGEQFAAQLGRDGIPDDIADLQEQRMNLRERLASFVAEHEDHVRNVPARYVVRTPRLFGEIGIEVDGLLANPDAIMCQSRLNGLLSLGVLDKLQADIDRRGRARVLEVGPGYGALAHALKGIFGERLEYICVDLPSSLYYSALYLSTLAGGEQWHVMLPGDEVPEHFNFLFVANYLIDELAASLGPIDLAMNTMSFPEMSVGQVRSYAELFARLLRPDGVVFDENGIFLPHHVDSDAILGSLFPYRKGVSSVLKISRDCQNAWNARYVPQIFDRSDAALGRSD